jgi:hypothetical protein
LGSTGTGRPADYHPSEPGDRCAEPLPEISLEDVATSEYFRRARAVPPRTTPVRLRTTLVGGRLGIEVSDTQELLGLVPTEYNYLRACISRGYGYAGAVMTSTDGPVPTVRVQLTAQTPR